MISVCKNNTESHGGVKGLEMKKDNLDKVVVSEPDDKVCRLKLYIYRTSSCTLGLKTD